MLNCFAFSDWRTEVLSIVRNDRWASNCELLYNAACLEPWLNSSPGDFFGVLVLLREVSFLTQLVPFFVSQMSFWSFAAVFDFWSLLFSLCRESNWCSFWPLIEWAPTSSFDWLLLNRFFKFFSLGFFYIHLPFYTRPCVLTVVCFLLFVVLVVLSFRLQLLGRFF